MMKYLTFYWINICFSYSILEILHNRIISSGIEYEKKLTI
jgi:hypothetical protein